MAQAALKNDVDWIRRSFLVERKDLAPDDFANRIWTSATLKYTDTTPGGNFAINSPPQITRYADLKASSKFSGSARMGRWYSENWDDNAQLIHMRFGTESFNSLTQFFGGFYNSDAGQLARTGRAKGLFYSIGKAIGFVVQLAAWKLLAVHFLGNAINFLSQKPSSKFYYSRPAMTMYWNAVSAMVNHMAVNRGIVPRMFGDDGRKLDKGYEFEKEDLLTMSKMGPDGLFKPGGGIDIYALANKAKRLERVRMEQVEAVLDNTTKLDPQGVNDAIRKIYSQQVTDKRKGASLTSEDAANPGAIQRWSQTDQSKPAGDGENTNDSWFDGIKKNLSKLWEFTKAEMDDGAAFATFRVNATGPVQESFTSNVGESELQSKINGMAAQARSANFSFANGNVIGGVVGAAAGTILDAARGVVTGIMDSVSISGLATLAGAAFVDIPKGWQSSMARLPQSQYTINLTCWNNNPLGQLLALDIPLCMLLAGALPKSTGKQSHVGPFMVELYDRGRCQTRLGIIDSISITRGVGNVGFTQDGKAMGIDITFSVLDMSSVMHMPITEGFTFLDAVGQAAGSVVGDKTQAVVGAVTGNGVFDEDTVYSDYLATLSGMALNDQIYGFRKLKMNMTRKMIAYANWSSTSHMASFLGDTFPMSALSAFFRGTSRR